MACLGECWDLGPPPDSILFLPPPPVPAFLQNSLQDLLISNTTCISPQLCESWASSNRVPDGGDYIELPRKDVETWSVANIDDTWLLVLVASSIGVLLLGALLAMFLLKCREMNMFGHNECSMHNRTDHHRQIKSHEPNRDCASVTNINSNKLVHPSEAVLYHGATSMHPDNRMVWAALTPRGTQHFISENYPRDLVDYVEADDHYETIENLNIQPVLPQHPTYTSSAYNTYHKGLNILAREKSSFDNSGFVDYEYEDPTPLIESYQMNDMEGREMHQYAMLGNTDMRCASLGMGGNSLRRGIPLGTAYRPRVSSPTRIEHPNLPPLNLYPHQGNTLKKNSLGYRNGDTLPNPKYGC